MQELRPHVQNSLRPAGTIASKRRTVTKNGLMKQGRVGPIQSVNTRTREGRAKGEGKYKCFGSPVTMPGVLRCTSYQERNPRPPARGWSVFSWSVMKRHGLTIPFATQRGPAAYMNVEAEGVVRFSLEVLATLQC